MNLSLSLFLSFSHFLWLLFGWKEGGADWASSSSQGSTAGQAVCRCIVWLQVPHAPPIFCRCPELLPRLSPCRCLFSLWLLRPLIVFWQAATPAATARFCSRACSGAGLTAARERKPMHGGLNGKGASGGGKQAAGCSSRPVKDHRTAPGMSHQSTEQARCKKRGVKQERNSLREGTAKCQRVVTL